MSKDQPPYQPAPPVPLGKSVEAEIIVAQQHEGKLLEVLHHQLQVPCRVADTSDLLGLSKIVVMKVESAARQLPARVVAIPSEASRRWQARYPPPDPKTAAPLDQVLWAVRGEFAARFSGWTPTIGKNRFVGQVHGVGEVNHGGGGDPVRATHGIPLADRLAGPGRGARIGVLDTAFYPQPWLAGGWSARFSDRIADADGLPFAQGHATFVTGLILGMAPGANVQVRSVLDADGMADSWTVAKAIVEFGATGLDVLNLSFACYTEDGEPPMVLAAAIDRLDPMIVVVAAAGNHGLAGQQDGFTVADADQPAWPAAFDDVIAVGATNNSGVPLDFSPDAPWVDVTAPGNKLLSTYLPRAGRNPELKFADYAVWSGTSFSAALVSGAIAAGIDPGRVTARDALGDISHWLRTHQDRPGVAPNFLPLTPPFGGDLET